MKLLHQTYSKKEIETSFAACRSIMKERAVSFYAAFKKLSEDRFKAVSAIYGFCRYSDDVTDAQTEAIFADDERYISHAKNDFNDLTHHEQKSSVRTKLDTLETIIEEIYADRADMLLTETCQNAEFIWLLAFVLTIETYNIPKEPFLAQINGQRQDLHFSDLNTMKELINYSKLVAGSVGMMLLPIITSPEHHSDELSHVCEELGVAMQITNILRDVGEDLRERNRIYIPKKMLEKYEMTKSDLLQLALTKKHQYISVPERFKQLWEEIATYSHKYYQGFHDHIYCFLQEAKLPLVAASLIYQGIEDAVRKEKYNCFTKRCYTGPVERVLLLKRAQKLAADK